MASSTVFRSKRPRTTNATGSPLLRGRNWSSVLAQTPTDWLFIPFSATSPGQVKTNDARPESVCLTCSTTWNPSRKPSKSMFCAT